MAYADTTSVAVTTAWSNVGTSPLTFMNSTAAHMQVFRQASGTPAASTAGRSLLRGETYSNLTSGEIIYARLMPSEKTAVPTGSILVDQWT